MPGHSLSKFIYSLDFYSSDRLCIISGNNSSGKQGYRRSVVGRDRSGSFRYLKMSASLFAASVDQINTLYLNAVRRSHVSGHIFVFKSFSLRIPKRVCVGEVWRIYLIYQLEPRFILSVLACRQDRQCVSPTEQNRTGYASGVRFWNLVARAPPFPFDSFEPPSTRRLW